MAKTSKIPQDTTFDIDPFPGKPKILFIGQAESSHTHAWIDLLQEAEFNVRLFALPTGGYPPTNWKIRTYLPAPSYPPGLDANVRQCLYPTHEERQAEQVAEKRNPLLKVHRLFLDGFFIHPHIQGFIRTCLAFLVLLACLPVTFIQTCRKKCRKDFFWQKNVRFVPPLALPKKEPLRSNTSSLEAWLAQIIQKWQPDIIHTLGLYDNQGGLFYYSVRQQFHLEGYGKWILQLRGGSDLTLRRHNPEYIRQIQQIFMECDQIISDNRINIRYAAEIGIPSEKFSWLTPVPGTGGMDVELMRSLCNVLPSQRERIILWPKAYNCPWSSAFPVFEAIKLAWENIKPCRIYMLAMIPETRMWFYAFPDEILQHCVAKERIPRQEVLTLMPQLRVLLAPTLVDGVPSSLYEAMAYGVFPIVSPLETITSVVQHEKNVLFARNLYPQEIANALVKAMTDDELVDQAARRNLELVKTIADRGTIRARVVQYYEQLVKEHRRK